MARKLFFSFHYERDAWRSGQVRNCNLLASAEQVGFIDAVDWESIKRQGREAIKRWIANQLNGTSVTVVLIGAETADREWVLHEIFESWNRGNGVVGVSIHNIKNETRQIDSKGSNPFEKFKLPNGRLLSEICKVYDWVANNGRDNLGVWAEEAARIRAQFKPEDKIAEIDGGGALVAAAAVGLGALALAAFSRPRSEPEQKLRPFTPRAPWCASDDND